MIYPKFLKNGNTIGVPATSGGAYKETCTPRFKNAKKNFEAMGYKVIESKNLFTSVMGRSAPAKERAKELNEMLDNDDIDFIITAAGGEFLMEVLPYVDFDIIKKHPKFIQGFSDTATLLYPITTNCDIATIYGINYKNFGMANFEQDLKNNLEIISGNLIEQKSFEMYEEEGIKRITGLEGYNLTNKVEWKIYNGNQAEFEGRIIGGCFDCINLVAGTKFDGGPKFVEKYKNDGIIWYFDVCEYSYEDVIRSLWKFNELGYFKNVKGVIFGRFGVENTLLGYTMEGLIKDSVLGEMNIPVIYGADISHKGPSMTIINGAIAKICVDGGKACLKLALL